MKGDEAKKIVAKQLGCLNDEMPSFDMETGQIKSKKANKTKSPEEQAIAELKVFEKKILFQILDVCFLNLFWSY